MLGRMPYIEVNDCLLRGSMMRIYSVLAEALDVPEASQGLTKSVVAEVLDLHPPNVWHLLKYLTQEGFVEETIGDLPDGVKGNPPRFYKAKYPITRRGVYLVHQRLGFTPPDLTLS